MKNRRQRAASQQGVTLIVTLIMLVLMMLLAVASINMSTTNLKIVGNMQFQQEATGAAQSAINQVLSSGKNLSEPLTAPSSIVVGAYTVNLARPCLISAVGLRDSELSNPPTVEDQKCKTSSKFDPMNVNALTDCARVTFQLTATVSDTASKASVTLVQGASMRMDRVLAEAYARDVAMVCS